MIETNGSLADELEAIATTIGIEIENYDTAAETLRNNIELINRLDVIETPEPPKRDHWKPDNDPLGAWINRCEVQGASDGQLAEYEIGIKDNISVAGVPLTCGSQILESFIADRDAEVVERMLHEGGSIVGKTNMDEFAVGEDERAMRLKLARNPHAPERQPGGSSSGSGVAVATGQVDVALGSDTGGSVRYPASWSGTIGLKPTRGLVPTDGFVHFSPTLDTIGVLGGDLETIADVLVTIANNNWQSAGIQSMDVTSAARGERFVPSDITIGIPNSLLNCEREVDQVVKTGLEELSRAGVTIRELTIPEFELSIPAWYIIGTIEFSHYIGDALTGWGPDEDPMLGLASQLGKALNEQPDELGPIVRDLLVEGAYLRRSQEKRFYAKGQIARQRVTTRVSEVFDTVDVLAGPTVPHLPPKWGEDVKPMTEAIGNTAPFNLTGHPAISIPGGTIGGLPVGLQFIAPHLREDILLAVSDIWKTEQD